MTVFNIAGTTSAANTGSTNSTNSTKSSSNSNLDQSAFLQLLVAQLQNQDPLSPMDDTQFVSQLATFNMLEQMTNMASDIEELKESMTAQSSQSLLTQGAAMIDKVVTYYGNDGLETSGTVTSVKLSGGSLSLMVGDTEVAMDNVLEVKNAG